MAFFDYDCPYCWAEMGGSFGDNVYCPICDITFETDCDLSCSEDGDESHYAWLTGVEYKGKVNINE